MTLSRFIEQAGIGEYPRLNKFQRDRFCRAEIYEGKSEAAYSLRAVTSNKW